MTLHFIAVIKVSVCIIIFEDWYISLFNFVVMQEKKMWVKYQLTIEAIV